MWWALNSILPIIELKETVRVKTNFQMPLKGLSQNEINGMFSFFHYIISYTLANAECHLSNKIS